MGRSTICLFIIFPLVALISEGRPAVRRNAGGGSPNPITFLPDAKFPAVSANVRDTRNTAVLGSALSDGNANRATTFIPNEEFSLEFGNMMSCGDGMCRCNATYADCSKHGANLTYIPQLPPGVTFLNFSYNRALISHADFFMNVTDIEHLELGSNRLKFISHGAFLPLKKLQRLNLGLNHLTYETLAPALSVKTLIKLVLIGLGLGPLPDDLFHRYPLSHLEELLLYGNSISRVNMSVFAPLNNLKQLLLGSNKIHQIHSAYLPQLRYLDLNDCGLLDFPDTCSSNTSSLFPHLENLSLKQNFISSLASQSVCLPELQILDLGENQISKILSGMFSKAWFPNLSQLLLSSMDTHVKRIERYAFNNSDLQTLEFYFNEVDFSFDTVDPDCFAGCTGLTFLSLGGNNFIEVSPKKLQRLLHPLRRLQSLNLGKNGIRDLHASSFSDTPSLVKLDLFNNRLDSIPDGTFNRLVNLTWLNLNRNNIQRVTETTFNATIRGRLQYLDLSENPFLCDCDLMWFHQWYVSKQSLFQNPWHDPYTCRNLPNTTLEAFYMNEQACLLSHEVYVFMTIVQVALLSFAFLVTALYRYRWHIRLVMYEAFRGRGDRWRRLQENHFQYDVFVSYAVEDSKWVMQYLMPELEDRLGLRLCLHQRDFIPGRHIVDNISECVERSKKVMMLFSSDFAKSPWCQFELALCLTHVMDHDDALVIACLHDISSRDLTPSMMAVMKTTTYVEWADDPDAMASFWGRLRIALNEIIPSVGH